jgi:sialidase-1
MLKRNKVFWLVILSMVLVSRISRSESLPSNPYGLTKVKDIVIYTNENFHCAFPSVVKRSSGELLVAFRRAPDRRHFGQPGVTHTDPNSYLVTVRSKDGGESWSQEPELLFAHPFGGSQDPCMVQLNDRSILCASYGWTLFNPKTIAKMTNSSHIGDFAFMGGYLLRSKDGGSSWQGPIIPASVPEEKVLDIFGKPVPAFNRGAMYEGKNGNLYWAVASRVGHDAKHNGTHLMISGDKGYTWKYSCPIALDDKITFNETSMYETPKGDLVAFMRSENFDDHACLARSTDGGKSFEKWQDLGFRGHPLHALRLPDKRVLLVYGYRHAPQGIRCRMLDAECTNAATAPEMILREDGSGFDLGYPWSTMISKDKVLVTYYFNQHDGPRYIAGTILKID